MLVLSLGNMTIEIRDSRNRYRQIILRDILFHAVDNLHLREEMAHLQELVESWDVTTWQQQVDNLRAQLIEATEASQALSLTPSVRIAACSNTIPLHIFSWLLQPLSQCYGYTILG